MSRVKHRMRWAVAPGARLALAGGVMGLALTACGSSPSTGGSSSASGSSALRSPRSAPFTGPTRPTAISSTPAASPPCTHQRRGGVMGHHLTCTIVDNRGEPADAVPAANNMLPALPTWSGSWPVTAA